MTLNRFTEFGMAHVLVGMRYAMELLQTAMDDLSQQLAAEQEGQTVRQAVQKKRKPGSGSKLKAYWDSMTQEERSAEMRRRGMARVSKKKAASQKSRNKYKREWAAAQKAKSTIKLKSTARSERLHPRDSRSPKHNAWRKMMQAAQLRRTQASRTAAAKKGAATRNANAAVLRKAMVPAAKVLNGAEAVA